MRFLEVGSATAAIVAAGLWLYSAKAEVYADNQVGTRTDNLIISKNGRKFDVTASLQKQSTWSAYAAIAAAVAALFQAASIILPHS